MHVFVYKARTTAIMNEDITKQNYLYTYASIHLQSKIILLKLIIFLAAIALHKWNVIALQLLITVFLAEAL